jgi:hypothetical protein
MWAFAAKSFGGGKTRSSCITDSIFVVAIPVLIPLLTGFLMSAVVYHIPAARDNEIGKFGAMQSAGLKGR